MYGSIEYPQRMQEKLVIGYIDFEKWSGITNGTSHEIKAFIAYAQTYKLCLNYANVLMFQRQMRIVVNKHWRGYLDFRRAGSLILQLY